MGTSLFDRPPLTIEELLKALSAQSGVGAAHALPATQTTVQGGPVAHMLPSVSSTAQAPAIAHALAAMRSANSPPPPSPDLPPMPDASSLPVETTPSGYSPTGAIGAMLQGLLATHPLNPANVGPQAGLLAQQGAPAGPPPVNVGGVSAPAPQAAPLPPMAAPQGPSMFDRIKGHLGGLLHSASTIGVPGDATEYNGLLSSDEIKAAKPGMLRSLAGIITGGALPDQQYESSLNHAVQLKQMASSIAEHQRVMDFRKRVAQEPPLEPDAPIEKIRARIASLYERAAAAGDTEMMKDYGARLTGIFAQPHPDLTKVVTPGATLAGPHGEALLSVPGVPKDTANDYTQYVKPDGNYDVLPKNVTPPKGWKPLSMNKTEVTVQGAADRAAVTRTDKGVKDYITQIKPLRDRAASIDQSLMTLNSAAHATNPDDRRVLYKSGMANFVQAADQKAQLRVQMLQYFDQIDPSLKGSWESLKGKLLSGERPAYQLQGMINHLQNLKGLVQGEIEAQRSGLVSRRPELDDALPKTEEYFPDFTASGTTSAKPAATGGRTVTVNGKTFKIPD